MCVCVCAGVCVYVDALDKSRCYKGLVSLESESGTCVCVCLYRCVCVCMQGKRSTSIELTFRRRLISLTADTTQKVADSHSRSK